MQIHQKSYSPPTWIFLHTGAQILIWIELPTEKEKFESKRKLAEEMEEAMKYFSKAFNYARMPRDELANNGEWRRVNASRMEFDALVRPN